MRHLLQVAVAGCALLLSLGAVVAAEQVVITGHITWAWQSALEPGGFVLGESYRLTFDWLGPGPRDKSTSPTVDFSRYILAGGNLRFEVANYWVSGDVVHYTVGIEPVVAPVVARAGMMTDWVSDSTPAIPLLFPRTVSDLFPYFVGVELVDQTGMALNTSELKSPLFDLSKFGARSLEVAFAREVVPDGVAFGVQRVFGTVETMTLVPEPASRALLLLGLTAMGWRAVARHRQQ